ncbi:MAG: DUF177 domain-containing protein [Alphaproteobacteria bacterium]
MEPAEFTHVVRIDDLPPKGLDISLEADKAQLATLTDRYGIPAVKALRGDLRVRYRKGPKLVEVTGRIKVVVTYDCVITLERFDSSHKLVIDEKLSRATPQEQVREAAFDAAVAEGEDDQPEVLEGNELDVAELVAELVALELEQFPRKPGVDLDLPEAEQIPEFELKDNPFAKLKDVKLPEDRG